MIVLNNVAVQHLRPGRPPVAALAEVTVRLDAGEKVAVFGANGSGKSTLLRVMAGLQRPARGSVSIFGYEASSSELPVELRRRIGFVFQNPEEVFAAETVAEEVRFALECQRSGSAVADVEVQEALARAGLAHLAGRPLVQLSGGEKQNVALCSALAAQPEIIFFDEPTSYLDPPARRAFLNHSVFTEDDEHRTTLLVTQYWEEAVRCRRVLVLESGRIVYDGAPSGYTSSGDATSGPELPLDQQWLVTVAAPTSNPLVLVEQLTQTTPVFPGELTNPLGDLSFAILPGERVGLVGPTGAGKTTLAYHLAGLMPKYQGRITVAGQAVGAAAARRRRPPVAMVFQNPEHHLFAETVAQDVAFGPRNIGFPKSQIDAHVEQSLKLAGLPPAEFGGCSPFEISAGEQRKAALAGALALPAALYIFDEPTAYLDRESVARMEALVTALSSAGKAVIIISHDLPFLRRVCPRWMILDCGRLVFDGPLAELDSNPAPLGIIGFA